LRCNIELAILNLEKGFVRISKNILYILKSGGSFGAEVRLGAEVDFNEAGLGM
jgi:hypothetical protein